MKKIETNGDEHLTKEDNRGDRNCVKSVQIRTRKDSVFGQISHNAY